MIENDKIKLTTVKILEELYRDFKKVSIDNDEFSLQKLVNRSMEKFLTEGVEKYYEIGPGRVLTGLMRRINRKTKVVNISSLDAINKLSDC